MENQTSFWDAIAHPEVIGLSGAIVAKLTAFRDMINEFIACKDEEDAFTLARKIIFSTGMEADIKQGREQEDIARQENLEALMAALQEFVETATEEGRTSQIYLENYLQEAGRAGRDQTDAKCVLLYDGNDVDTQFGISKISQIELRDLKSVWKKIGYLNEAANGKNGCGKIVATGGEILRDTDKYMSFDSDDRQADTKVKTALAWLERAGMLQRTENQTRIFPARSGRLDLQQALHLIEAGNFSQRIRDIYSLIAQIVFDSPDDRPLSTDDLIQATGCSFTELRGHLKKLEELGILTNDTMMTIILRTDNTKPSEKQLLKLLTWEEKLWKVLKDEIPHADQGEWQNLSLTAVCDKMREADLETNPADIKLMMQSLADDKSARKETRTGSFQLLDGGNNLLKVRFKDRSDSWESVQETAELRRKAAACLLSFLITKTNGVRQKDVTVETRMGELVEQLAEDVELSVQISPKLREPLLRQALLFMHKQGIIKLNHGMTILRHAMTIIPDKNAIEARRQYLKEDFKPLEEFYGERRFQVHVMQEYALRALDAAMQDLARQGQVSRSLQQSLMRVRMVQRLFLCGLPAGRR